MFGVTCHHRQVYKQWFAPLEIDELYSVPGCLNVVTLNQCLLTPVIGKTTCLQLNSRSSWIPQMYRETQGREDHPPSLQSAVVFLSSAQACHGAIGVVQPLIGNTRPPVDTVLHRTRQNVLKIAQTSRSGSSASQNRICDLCQHPMSHKYGATGSMTPSTGSIRGI